MKHYLRLFLIVLLLVFIMTGCGRQNVRIELVCRSNPPADLTPLNNFAVLSISDTNTEAENLLLAEISDKLSASGYKYEEKNPDFVVAAVCYSEQKEEFDPKAEQRVEFTVNSKIYSISRYKRPVSAQGSSVKTPTVVVRTQKSWSQRTNIGSGEDIGGYVTKNAAGVRLYFLKPTPGKTENVTMVMDPANRKVYNVPETELLWEAQATFNGSTADLNAMIPVMVDAIMENLK